jgi:hypothetical protein
MMFRLSHSVVGALALIASGCSDNGNFAPSIPPPFVL